MIAVGETQLDKTEVRRRREALGLTMEAAAKAAGFSSRQAWWNVESGPGGGDIPVSTLGRLARALKCDPDDLLTTPDD